MSTLYNLPILEITKENIETEYARLVQDIRESSFLSLDIEMTGLGNRKQINTQLVLYSSEILF